MAVVGNGGSSAWWSRRWMEMLTRLGMNTDLAQARQTLRGCRVQRLEVLVGEISARVRDRELGDCPVTIRSAPLSDEQWEAVLDALSSQALFTAQLLAGDMPPEIEDVFAQAGAALLPPNVESLQHECGCCNHPDRLCRPLLATYLALGEMLSEDPWLLFRLRGRDRDHVLRDLRVRRSRSAAPGAAPQPRPTLAEEPVAYRLQGDTGEHEETPLAAQIEHYWGRSKRVTEFHHHIAPPLIELALLRRLGPLPYSTESLDAQDELAELYRRVTRSGLALAYAGEPERNGDAAPEA